MKAPLKSQLKDQKLDSWNIYELWKLAIQKISPAVNIFKFSSTHCNLFSRANTYKLTLNKAKWFLVFIYQIRSRIIAFFIFFYLFINYAIFHDTWLSPLITHSTWRNRLLLEFKAWSMWWLIKLGLQLASH